MGRARRRDRWSGLPHPDELSEVLRAWAAVIEPLADRWPVGHRAQRPADATPVSFTLVAVPIARTEHGG